MTPLSPVEILKNLPRTNCKECGYPTCLAFAMAIITGSCEPAKCPYFAPKDWPKQKQAPKAPDEDFAWKILAEVKKKVQTTDFAAIAPQIGAKYQEGKLKLRFLDTIVFLDGQRIFREDGKELDPRDQILLYNYVIFAGRTPLRGEYLGLESFPNSLSKTATLRKYAEEKLASHFSQKLKDLEAALTKFNHQRPSPCPADFCTIVWVLPRVPLKIHFFDAEPGDNLPAEVKILFDAHATSYLDLESLVFCAERLVERLIELSEEES